MPDGWRHWLRSDEHALERGFVPGPYEAEVRATIVMLREDAGRNLGFTRLVARRA